VLNNKKLIMETSLHCYIVIYDNCTPRFDYTALESNIKNFYSWGRLTDNTWAIVTSLSAADIRNNLKEHLGENDKLIVIKSGCSAAWTKVFANDFWLKENLIL